MSSRSLASTIVLGLLFLSAAACGEAAGRGEGGGDSAAASAAGAGATAGASAAGTTTADTSGASQGSQAAAAGDTSGAQADTTRPRGDSARFAARWAAVKHPPVLPGSIFPAKRVVAYYGNPLSKRMGILGEIPPDQMMARLEQQAKEWERADPGRPVVRMLELVTIVAQGTPGKDGKYRYRAHPELIEKVYGWAKSRGWLFMMDIQVGHSDVPTEVAALLPWLQRPDVHLALDPEFDMSNGVVPGRKIGTTDAAAINHTVRVLADLVTKHKLPPKILVVHRFTRGMVTNAKDIKLDSRVQVVIDMDGWGAPFLKRATYRQYVASEPVQYTGFKLFYHNDTKKGHPLMKPADVLKLYPKPVFIMYQ